MDHLDVVVVDERHNRRVLQGEVEEVERVDSSCISESDTDMTVLKLNSGYSIQLSTELARMIALVLPEDWRGENLEHLLASKTHFRDTTRIAR